MLIAFCSLFASICFIEFGDEVVDCLLGKTFKPEVLVFALLHFWNFLIFAIVQTGPTFSSFSVLSGAATSRRKNEMVVERRRASRKCNNNTAKGFIQIFTCILVVFTSQQHTQMPFLPNKRSIHYYFLCPSNNYAYSTTFFRTRFLSPKTCLLMNYLVPEVFCLNSFFLPHLNITSFRFSKDLLLPVWLYPD